MKPCPNFAYYRKMFAIKDNQLAYAIFFVRLRHSLVALGCTMTPFQG